MSHFRLPALTQRTVRPDAVAWVDPQFPVDQLWSPDVRPQLVVERGEDVVLNGELTVAGGTPLFTGQHLAGTYATYWTSNGTATGIAILQAGAAPVGGVDARAHFDAESGVFAVTTREGLDLAAGPLPEHHNVVTGAGTSLLSSPTGFGAGDIDLTALLDSQHQPCGYVFNGDLLQEAWEARILPGETGRVSAETLLHALRDVPEDSQVEVMAVGSSLFGGTRTKSIGWATGLDFTGRSWAASVARQRTADTVAAMTYVAGADLVRPGPDLPVSIGVGRGEERWVTAIEWDNGAIRLVLGPEPVLPDAGL